MATITTCDISRIETTETGSQANRYVVIWDVVADDQIDGIKVLELARLVTPSATVTPIPFKGAFYSYTSPGNVRTKDNNALALDFDVQAQLDDMKTYTVRVTFRAPQPGEEEEVWNVGKHPLDRDPYYWIEYYTETEEVFDARLPSPLKINGKQEQAIGQGTVLRQIGEKGPITTAAGEEVDIATDEKLHTVLVVERNVLSPRVAMIINSLFFGNMNSNRWQLPFEFRTQNMRNVQDARGRVFRHKARFLRAETEQYGRWWDGDLYYKMQVRVRVAPREFYKQIPNRGTWKYLPSPDSKVALIRDDDAVLRKGNLNRDGSLATTELGKPILIPYQVSDDVTFNAAVGFANLLPTLVLA